MDIRLEKEFIIAAFQCGLLCLLFISGTIFEFLYLTAYRGKYMSYCFTHARLIELKTTLTNGCSDLTHLPCSLQMHIGVYFFWSKLLTLYWLTIAIGIIYKWHRTVHFSHCFFTFCVLADIIFRTDLVLYLDSISVSIAQSCFMFFAMSAWLECFMPHDSNDQLRTLCERFAHPDNLNECFPFDDSKYARFYRWAMDMKKQWNIEEEKLIGTLIVAIFAVIVMTTILTYIENSSSLENDVCNVSKLI